jgi:hypothetical protein
LAEWSSVTVVAGGGGAGDGGGAAGEGGGGGAAGEGRDVDVNEYICQLTLVLGQGAVDVQQRQPQNWLNCGLNMTTDDGELGHLGFASAALAQAIGDEKLVPRFSACLLHAFDS